MKKRRKVLLLSDDIRIHSGIGTISKELVLGTASEFDWVNLGAAIDHPESGKALDVSADINKSLGITDSSVKIIPYNGYGDAGILRHLLNKEKPDAIVIFTDPRYWEWLFKMEREIRSKVPIIYLNIWDNLPAPYYNKPFYESCDMLLAISKQTKVINELVLGDNEYGVDVRYLPHAVNPKMFYNIAEKDSKFQEFKTKLLKGKHYEFILLYNSRNIRRKSPSDIIFAFAEFTDSLTPVQADKCALIMHTDPVDSNGTDLKAVEELVIDRGDVIFSTKKISTEEMNYLYNLSDVTVLTSSNEGWGIALTEAIMAERMVIANVTGGMQDQLGFVDSNNNPVNLTKDFPSNHRGTYKKHGVWAEPVFPSNISIVGSPKTPYIFDDRCSYRDIAKAMNTVYRKTPKERAENGSAGRKWAMSPEVGMSANVMSTNFVKHCNYAMDKFTPRNKFAFTKVGIPAKTKITHPLIY